ncbi:hypothetical protein QV65_10480, partial [Rhodococcus erythropolis]
MGRLFGTDGVRGLANSDLTADLALRLAAAAASVLTAGTSDARPTAVIGRDPRASGEMLQAAVTAGLSSAGVDVLDVGILPTPAVAYLTAKLDASLGVMISASHNPCRTTESRFSRPVGTSWMTLSRWRSRLHSTALRRRSFRQV